MEELRRIIARSGEEIGAMESEGFRIGDGPRGCWAMLSMRQVDLAHHRPELLHGLDGSSHRRQNVHIALVEKKGARHSQSQTPHAIAESSAIVRYRLQRCTAVT